MRRATDGLSGWLVIGVIGWAGILYLGWLLWQATPPHAGFDLSLLLQAARRVSTGQSPYDPAMLAGTSPDATSLFYSYPPVVAQAMTLVAWLPDGVVLILWAIGATVGLGLVAWRIALAAARPSPGIDAAKAVAVAPLVLPFTVALLFGNLDAWYGLAFGALVLGVALPGPTRGRALAAGIALGVVSVAKLHPASLFLWLVTRWTVDRGGRAGLTLMAAVATAAAIAALSLAAGGFGPWQDYLAVLRTGSGAVVIDPRNAGPVSMLGQVITLDTSSVRVAQVAVALLALAVTVVVAARVRDALLSVGIAITASLVVLPVTWYHYPVALIPLGAALVLSRRASRVPVAIAAILADVAIAFAPLLWLGVGALLLAPIQRVWNGEARAKVLAEP